MEDHLSSQNVYDIALYTTESGLEFSHARLSAWFAHVFDCGPCHTRVQVARQILQHNYDADSESIRDLDRILLDQGVLPKD